jgi:WD40 repeat protein/serine/threonine protein kinase/DNA-binding winged helix-turn-helix (wHTH) protein
VEFRLLGPLEVRSHDGPIPLGGAKQRVVLAHLLLRANALVPADRLIDEVWGDGPPPAARNVLQTYVSRLRKAVGAERLERRPSGYVLHADPSEIDAHRFDALVREARRKAPTDPASGVQLYREADALWRGPALDDLAEQSSLRGEIAQLEELRLAATEQRIVAELSLGHHAELIPELETLTALHPLRESLWAHLMTALYRSGRQADALAAYRRARTLLVEDLGLEPSSELRRLEQQVLTQDPALDVAGRPLRGFRLLERVGEGSFGVVHRAVQPQVGREVAVKVIRPTLANDPEFIRRFEAEAQLVARLEHPHIVPLYDYWREPDGAFLVMRFLRGGSLREALEGGPLPLGRALDVVDHVGGALAAAHRQGVVHRDVKPANILLDEEGNAYLSDFGIARDVALARTPARGRSPDTSAYYLSPEEIRGEAPTTRADVYSLGLVLHEMLAGRHPFADVERADRLRGRVRVSVPPLLADVSRGVHEIVWRSTLDDPAERYPDAAAVLSALATAVEAAPRTVAVPTGPARNPYKGLRPFLESDAPDFKGRENLVRRLVDRLGGARLLALVGPSGSGKSSVVRAGLVPAVRAGAVAGSERWFVAEMLPGADPFGELTGALVRVAPAAPPAELVDRIERDEHGLVEAVDRLLPEEGSELLLVIDQFEELFTLVDDDERRGRFLAALQAAATDPRSRVRIVLTLRADFLDRPLAHLGFAKPLRAGTELILPLTADELERAISGPAGRVGVRVDAGLAAELVSDVVGQPGALPLLQFTLAELFDRREDGVLKPAAYREVGGVAGAVARGAEEAYAGLGEDGKDVARQLFLRLVDAGEAISRRRVVRSELLSLTDDAAMEAAIDAFARRRLLSFDRDLETREPTVEIAHDALLQAWDRLRDWIAEAREDLRTQQQLATAAREWREAGRDPSFVVRGARLERLESWRGESALALTPGEREFLDASLAERDRLRAEEAARRARERELERRSLRRLRAVVAVLAAAAIVAGALTVFAFDQRSDAQREGRIAEARELAAAAVANLDVDAERSILLALEAVNRTREADGTVLPEAREALHRAVVASRITLRVPGLGGALDWSPDGKLFVTEGPEESGLIDIRDARTGRRVRSFRGHDADVNLVAFSADGAMLATTGDDGTAKVWDPRTGRRLHTFTGERGPVWGASFSPDGSRLAAAWPAEQAVRIYDLETGRRIRDIRPVAASFATSFSPNGRRLAIATSDSPTSVVDVRSGRTVLELKDRPAVRDVDWSPDGRWIATSTEVPKVRLWDARTGRLKFTLFGHKSDVVAADWSADSRRLATGSSDGTARVWEVGPEGTREVLSISAQERGGGLWVAFSPDGERLMTGAQDISAVKVWDVTANGGAEWANLPAEDRHLGGVAFTPDGTRVATGNVDGSVTIRDVRSPGRSFTLRGPPGSDGPAIAVDVSRRGAVAATASEVARTWDLVSRKETFTVKSPGGAEDVAWSADGSLLAVGSMRGEITIVDRTGKELAVLRIPERHRIAAVQFSPDGRLVAAASMPMERPEPGAERVTIWDWRRGKMIRELPALAEGIDFSHDGRRIATAPVTGPARIWDVRSGRLLARLAGHTGAAYDAAFAPDDSIVATASADGTVRLWDPRTGRQDVVLRHDGVVWDVDFSPDGSKLASASPLGIVRIWALDLDDLIAIAKRKVTRGLTADECRQYLHGRGCR